MQVEGFLGRTTGIMKYCEMSEERWGRGSICCMVAGTSACAAGRVDKSAGCVVVITYGHWLVEKMHVARL